MLFVILFVSAFIAGDCAVIKKDAEGKSVASGVCPTDRPFAYLDGTHCCKSSKEDVDPQLGSKCDGSELSLASSCCKNNKFVVCPHGKCKTNPASNVCPADHAYAFSKGSLCCKFNKEKADATFGANCDGSEISRKSKCCKDDKFVVCPHGKCATNPEPAVSCEITDTVSMGTPYPVPAQKYVTISCKDSHVVGFRSRAGTDYVRGIQLMCSDGSQSEKAEHAIYGAWGQWQTCDSGAFVKGFNFRRLDLVRFTLATQIKMECSNGKELLSNGPNRGTWESPEFKHCPGGEFVGGVTVELSSATIGSIDFNCGKC